MFNLSLYLLDILLDFLRFVLVLKTESFVLNDTFFFFLSNPGGFLCLFRSHKIISERSRRKEVKKLTTEVNPYQIFQSMTLLSLIRQVRVDDHEKRALMLGLDSAGKTTVVKNILNLDTSTMSPTFGFDIHTLQRNNLTLNIWDIGGQSTIRSYWRTYFDRTDAIIWVVDSFDIGRIDECASEFLSALHSERLIGATLLILANKQDLPGALTSEEVLEELGVDEVEIAKALSNRRWGVFPVSAKTGKGISEALDWLISDLSTQDLPLLECDDEAVISSELENDLKREGPRLIELTEMDLAGVSDNLARMTVSEFLKIVDKYADNLPLLTPFAGRIIENLSKNFMTLLSTHSSNLSKFKKQILNYSSCLYSLVKYQPFCDFFPRSFEFISILLFLLKNSNSIFESSDDQFWKVTLVSITWVSELVLSPFDLQTVNNHISSDLFDCFSMGLTSSVDVAASSLGLARLLIRNDCQSLREKYFNILNLMFDWVKINDPDSKLTLDLYSSSINFDCSPSTVSYFTGMIQTLYYFF
ncbi:hypothetical protein GEMRC1_006152 [Eukaryota sp. GEM-RC1]